MQENKNDKTTFWKGVSAGLLAGMAIAAALRYTPFEKFIAGLSTIDGKLDRAMARMEVKPKGEPETVGQSPLQSAATPADTRHEAAAARHDAFFKAQPPSQAAQSEDTQFKDSQLEAPHEAQPLDDFAAPSTLAAARTQAVAGFLRSGAVVRGRVSAPGIDLPRPDHIDLTRPVGASPSNFDLGSAG